LRRWRSEFLFPRIPRGISGAKKSQGPMAVRKFEKISGKTGRFRKKIESHLQSLSLTQQVHDHRPAPKKSITINGMCSGVITKGNKFKNQKLK
jgi:hypothetical protein